ncbi:23S rRNA (uracil(1939)-C(5))-methyltransferase RlmD, partial [bacterium]|nr:23S rRNA (uracil(1939)-C(5))-methyltransferase RlmD [bacterium]
MNSLKHSYKKGQVLSLEILTIAYKGLGVARHHGVVVLVRGAYPGETVEAGITRIKRDYLEAKTIRVINPDTLRIEPQCPHFGECGGCTWQDIPYTRQLEFKQSIVRDSFNSIGKLYDLNLEIPFPKAAISPFNYRNKMEFSFTQNQDKGIRLGLHKKGRFDAVVPLDNCLLVPPRIMEITSYISNWFNDKGVRVYDQYTREGLLKYVTFRYSFARSEMMVILTVSGDYPDFKDWSNSLLEKFKELKSVYLVVNDTPSSVATGQIQGYNGEKVIREELGGMTFEISPFSFFQPNSLTAEVLYNTFLGELNFKDKPTVIDLYAGTCTIGIICSQFAEKVYCIESEEYSLLDGVKNAVLNGIHNLKIECGKAEVELPRLIAEGVQPELLIVDPPRPGLHKNVIRTILKSAP